MFHFLLASVAVRNPLKSSAYSLCSREEMWPVMVHRIEKQVSAISRMWWPAGGGGDGFFWCPPRAGVRSGMVKMFLSYRVTPFPSIGWRQKAFLGPPFALVLLAFPDWEPLQSTGQDIKMAKTKTRTQYWVGLEF